MEEAELEAKMAEAKAASDAILKQEDLKREEEEKFEAQFQK